MKYLVIIFLLTILVLNICTASESVELRRKALVSIIDEEFSEVARLSKNVGGRNPDLILRMAELMLEKARLIKDAEHARFLKMSPKQRSGVSRRRFYTKSKRYFNKAQKLCSYILVKHRRFSNKGEVYYIMGYNAKEFKNKKRAIKYFQLALKNGKNNRELRRRTQIVLGEMYYIDGKYKKAIPLYKNALSSKKDKWWTKDAYNLAWCYFRTGKSKKSIKLMKEILVYSKKPRFVDVSRQVERDMPYIYTESGNYSDSVKYFKRKKADVTVNLIKVSQHLRARGKYKKALGTLSTAKKNARTNSEKIAVLIEELAVLDRKRDFGRHLKSCKELAAIGRRVPLSKKQLEVLTFNVKNMSAKLQREVTSKQLSHNKKRRRIRANQAVGYFNLLADIEPKKSHLHYFHAGETLYAAEKYQESLGLYKKAEATAKLRHANKIALLAQQGILAAVGKSGVSKSTKDKYIITVYESYLKANPTSKKSYKMYQHLFSAYYDKGDISSSEKILIKFRRTWPKAVGVQEAMLARVMDYYKNKNDKENMRRWVKKIGTGEFVVSSRYAKKVNLLMMTMQFESTEKALSRGDKVFALKGYVGIYQDKHSSSDAKKNAAYNIAYLFYQLGYIEKMSQWASRSIELMNGKDVKKFQASFLSMATMAHDKRKEDLAFKIHDSVLKKTCTLKTKYNDDLFRNLIIIRLSQNRVGDAVKYLLKSKRCILSNSVLLDGKKKIIAHVITSKRFSIIEDTIKQLEGDKQIWGDLIPALFLIMNELSEKRDRDDISAKIMRYYHHARKRGSVSVASLNVIAHIKLLQLERKIVKFNNIKLVFPEKKYSKLLSKKINGLNVVTTEALQILSIGSGRGIVKAYRLLVESYQVLVDEVNNIVPPNNDKNYLKSFRKGMLKVTSPLQRKISEFKREAKKHIYNSEILSKDNFFFLKNYKGDFHVRYFPDGPIVMDRGGRR